METIHVAVVAGDGELLQTRGPCSRRRWGPPGPSPSLGGGRLRCGLHRRGRGRRELLQLGLRQILGPHEGLVVLALLMNASSRLWAMSSWIWTGGLFMK